MHISGPHLKSLRVSVPTAFISAQQLASSHSDVDGLWPPPQDGRPIALHPTLSSGQGPNWSFNGVKVKVSAAQL